MTNDDDSSSLSDAQVGESQWTTNDGLPIFVRKWFCRPSHATVLLLHGIGDHSGRLAHVAQRLNQSGYSVIAPDWRGNGRSGGRRGYVPSFDILLDDCDLFVKNVRDENPGQSVILYGQSLGGLLSLYYAIKRQPDLAAVIATSPPLRVAMSAPRWKIWIGKTLGKCVPKISLNTGLDLNELCDDAAVVTQLRSDPLRHQRIGAGLYFGMLAAGDWCLEHANSLQVPTLIMHGAVDRITDCTGSDQFVQNGMDRCDLKIWPRGKHELHNMKDQQEVLSFLVGWLDAKIKENGKCDPYRANV